MGRRRWDFKRVQINSGRIRAGTGMMLRPQAMKQGCEFCQGGNDLYVDLVTMQPDVVSFRWTRVRCYPRSGTHLLAR